MSIIPRGSGSIQLVSFPGGASLWVGCDMTVNVAVDSVVAAAKKGGCRCLPTNRPTRGAARFSTSAPITARWDGSRVL